MVQGMSNAYNALITEITEGAVDGTIPAGEMRERDDFLRGPRHDAQVVRTDVRVPKSGELYCDFRDDDYYYVMYEADGFRPRSRPEDPEVSLSVLNSLQLRGSMAMRSLGHAIRWHNATVPAVEGKLFSVRDVVERIIEDKFSFTTEPYLLQAINKYHVMVKSAEILERVLASPNQTRQRWGNQSWQNFKQLPPFRRQHRMA